MQRTQKFIALMLVGASSFTHLKGAGQDAFINFTVENTTDSFLEFIFGVPTIIEQGITLKGNERAGKALVGAHATKQAKIEFPRAGWLKVAAQPGFFNDWGDGVTTGKGKNANEIYVTPELAKAMNGKKFKFVKKDETHFWSPDLIDFLVAHQKVAPEAKEEKSLLEKLKECEAELLKWKTKAQQFEAEAQ